jgi:hypothetical protein
MSTPSAPEERTETPSENSSRPHLRVVPPPRTEPTSTGATGPTDTAAARPVQGTLALLYALPSGAPAAPERGRHLRLTSYRPRFERDADDNPVPTPRADLAEPRAWAGRLIQAAVDASVGDRPVAQLLRWTTREVYDQLVRSARPVPVKPGSRTPRRRRATVRSLHLSEPADGIVEACAVVHDGERGRAVAVRLEGLDGRWVCTALELT